MMNLPHFTRRSVLFCGLALMVWSSSARAASETAPVEPSSPSSSTLAKFEPAQGCYVGAFIERDFTVGEQVNKYQTFEELTKKKHASYFTYVGYGRPFPAEWVEQVKAQNAAPHIAFEPNNGLDEVADGPYLRAWARDAARAKCPIFLRWASEMNGPWTRYGKDPAQYREKFRLLAQIMKEEAPNVAMVWTPFAKPQARIPLYYPGDDVVDWVGVNIYSVYVHNGDPFSPAFQENPVDALRYVYDTYAARKPVHISEFAATIYCKGTAQDTIEFAITNMTRFYNAVRREFPRVKSVNWFCLDTVRAGLANNNYSLLDDGRVLATYRKLMNDDYFLSKVDFDVAQWPQTVKAGTTLGPNGAAFRAGLPNSDDLIASAGAIATDLKDPMLRGLKNGDIVTGDLLLRAQMPLNLEARGIIWQIDGRTVALTNSAPYRITIARQRLSAGKHTARVLVVGKGAAGAQHESPTVEFEVRDEAGQPVGPA